MSKTTTAGVKPALEPHSWQATPDDPRTCGRCPLPRSNVVHNEDLIAAHQADEDAAAARLAEAQAAHRRRTGES